MNPTSCGYCTSTQGLIVLRCNHYACRTCANKNAQTSEIKGILKSNNTEDGQIFVCSIKCPICQRDTKQSTRIMSSSPPPSVEVKSKILNGTRICTTGFTPECYHLFLVVDSRIKLQKAIESNGGIFYAPLITKECSHLIVFPTGDKYTIARKSGIICISEKWVYDSIDAGEKLNESNYLILSQEEVSMAEMKIEPQKQVHEENDTEKMKTDNVEAEKENMENMKSEPVLDDKNDAEQKKKFSSELFSQFCFVSEGFDATEKKILHTVISENGGCILDDLSSKFLKPDFVICRDLPRKNRGVTAVSPLWVDWCIKDEKLFDPKSNPIFAPLPSPVPYPSMSSVRISFYGFDATDTTALVTLCELLGASFSGPSCERITHIITKPSRIPHLMLEPGINLSRYHLVSHDWLFECAIKGARVNEKQYILELPHKGSRGHHSDLTPRHSPHSRSFTSTPSTFITRIKREDKETADEEKQKRGRSPTRSHSPSNDKSNRSSRRSRSHTRSPGPPSPSSSSHYSPHSSNSSRHKSRSRSRSRTRSRSRSRGRKISISDGDLPTTYSPSQSHHSSSHFHHSHHSISSNHSNHSRHSRNSSRHSHRSHSHSSTSLMKSEQQIVDNYNFDNHPANESQMAEQLGHILKGAKVYISKKLDMKIQTQLHDLISKIGGIPTWIYDKSVTHYIHEGPRNKTQEFLLVSSNPNQRMVHPMWLLKCVDMGVRVKEDYFSPRSNPRMVLQLNDVPSTWVLPDRKDLLDYKPTIPDKSHKHTTSSTITTKSSFPSLSSLEHPYSPSSTRGSNPTPHPAKRSKRSDSNNNNNNNNAGKRDRETVRSHSSPEFSVPTPTFDREMVVEKIKEANIDVDGDVEILGGDNEKEEPLRIDSGLLALRELADKVKKMESLPFNNKTFTPQPAVRKKHLDRSVFEFTPPKLTPASSSSSGSSKNSQIVIIDYNDQERKKAELLEKIKGR